MQYNGLTALTQNTGRTTDMTTIMARPGTKTGPKQSRDFSRWHEECMEHLLTQSGLSVTREPNMAGKTPDLLVQGKAGQPFVVECIARLPDPQHAAEMDATGHHVCNGGICELHANVYSRLDQKATKYKEIAKTMPYIIALYDGSCLNSLQTAVDMTMSPYRPTIERAEDGRVTRRHYNTLWSSQEIPAALFDLYPHLSGLIYSRWPREHHYLPNPNALRPVSPDNLPFASVPPLPASRQPATWNPRPATLNDSWQEPPEQWLNELRHTSDAALGHLYAA